MSQHPMLASKIQAAHERRAILAGRGSANVLPTVYFAPGPDQAEALLVALLNDGDFRNETQQEEQSANTVFVFRKRNLSAGEQPTIVRYGYNAGVEDLVLTITGTALPAGFSLEGIKPHEVVTAEKASAKRKATAKADRKRTEAFAALGF